MRANHSRHSLKMEQRSKERREKFALGHKKGKIVENCQKHGKNTNFFRENSSFFESERVNLEQITHIAILKSNESNSLMSLFCKEQRERFAHGCSFVKSD